MATEFTTFWIGVADWTGTETSFCTGIEGWVTINGFGCTGKVWVTIEFVAKVGMEGWTGTKLFLIIVFVGTVTDAVDAGFLT